MFFCGCGKAYAIRAVNFGRDSFDFFLERQIVLIDEVEVVFSLYKTQNFFRELNTACAAFAPDLRKCDVYPKLPALFSDQRKFCLGICWEAVNRDNTWKTKIARDVFDMLQKIWQTLAQHFQIFVV